MPLTGHPNIEVGVIGGAGRLSPVFPGGDHSPSAGRICRAVDRGGAAWGAIVTELTSGATIQQGRHKLLVPGTGVPVCAESSGEGPMLGVGGLDRSGD